MTAKLKQRRWLKDRAKMVCCSTELVISSTEATTNDTKADATAVVKSIILEKYPSAKINYTDENSTGYFEYENEYYSFTVENNNIIVKGNTGKMINVLQIN